MSPEEPSTREKVLKATIRLLGKSEPEKLTIRQIAAEAGVNIAAVNYHFRTKENLVEEAVFAFSEKSFAMGMGLLRNRDVEPSRRLGEFLKGYAYGLVEFRGITKTAFLGILNAENAGGRYAGFTREMFAAVKEIVAELGAEKDEASNSRKTLMLFSAVVFPFLFLESFGPASGVDYRDRGERDRYIDMLVRNIQARKE